MGRFAEYRNCDGITRRNFVHAGFLGLGGLTLSEMLRGRAQAAEQGRAPRKTAVIFIELNGGPSHMETYDPKPEAPAEYRGLYGAVPTNVPGVQLSDRMPQQARVMDKLAIVRSIEHDSSSHRSRHMTQTGYYLQNRTRENEMPSIGSIAAKVRGANAEGLPPYVGVDRPITYADAAYLGGGYNPFVTGGNPNSKNFQVRNLEMPGRIDAERLNDRQRLRKTFDESRRILDREGLSEAMDDFQQQAMEMVTGRKARDAFNIHKEDPRTRERYGRNSFGQSLLLARRLVESGVTFVTARIGTWDHHNRLKQRMEQMGPRYDQGVAALVEDLHERGLDQDVLVVAMGEFGRTPKMNNRSPAPGRDHWGPLMSVLMAGGGLPVGQVVGSSNDKGEVPVDTPYRPENVLAMTYRHLDIDPSQTFLDNSGRPRYILEERDLIHELV